MLDLARTVSKWTSGKRMVDGGYAERRTRRAASKSFIFIKVPLRRRLPPLARVAPGCTLLIHPLSASVAQQRSRRAASGSVPYTRRLRAYTRLSGALPRRSLGSSFIGAPFQNCPISTFRLLVFLCPILKNRPRKFWNSVYLIDCSPGWGPPHTSSSLESLAD